LESRKFLATKKGRQAETAGGNNSSMDEEMRKRDQSNVLDNNEEPESKQDDQQHREQRRRCKEEKGDTTSAYECAERENPESRRNSNDKAENELDLGGEKETNQEISTIHPLEENEIFTTNVRKLVRTRKLADRVWQEELHCQELVDDHDNDDGEGSKAVTLEQQTSRVFMGSDLVVNEALDPSNRQQVSKSTAALTETDMETPAFTQHWDELNDAAREAQSPFQQILETTRKQLASQGIHAKYQIVPMKKRSAH